MVLKTVYSETAVGAGPCLLLPELIENPHLVVPCIGIELEMCLIDLHRGGLLASEKGIANNLAKDNQMHEIRRNIKESS